jgi:hypothetical protein
VDGQADQYALACVAFTLLAGAASHCYQRHLARFSGMAPKIAQRAAAVRLSDEHDWPLSDILFAESIP